MITEIANMSRSEAEFSEPVESQIRDSIGSKEASFNMNHGSNECIIKENGESSWSQCHNGDHDQLLQMVIELTFQNEYFKSQLWSWKNIQTEAETRVKEVEASEDIRLLYERIKLLGKEVSEEKQTRRAAEEALKHLQDAHSEADAKAQELNVKLAEAQQKMDQDKKEREERYSELDSKFSRLHKRAKQRIQEVQKEKDDLEARFRDVNERAERAISEQSQLQLELERTRQQANEALKAIDADRQQLRSANNNLRDNIEELRRSLEPKDNAIDALQLSLNEKDQTLEELRGLLQVADEKRQAAIAELSAKHQKHIESLEAQIADAISDRNKATDTISSLQVLLAEKESKIAELDAASSGEAVRLRAAVDSIKGEIVHLQNERGKEKENWDASMRTLKSKLEVAESNCIRAEIEAAKMRSQLEFELSVQTQLLSKRDAELKAAKEENDRLQSEFSSYKVRAHALLQKKDADLAAATDSEQLKALEEALKEAEKEMLLASAEKDRALHDVEDLLTSHDKELAARDAALKRAEQQIKSLESKLDSAHAHFLLEKEKLQVHVQNLEETWRSRCEALKTQKEASSGRDVQKELEELILHYEKLKEEHDSFRDLADRMIEEKDKELSKLLDDNENLHRSLELKPSAGRGDNYNTDRASLIQDATNSSTSAAEQQILLLARQQAQREEELAQSQRHILALQEEIEELERENRLHSQQEAMLKDELRNMERTQKREGVDMTYLKNVILKLLETGEVEALLPVVGMLLQFSPEEMQKCHQAYRNSLDVPPSPGASDNTSGSGLSLLSRFSFS